MTDPTPTASAPRTLVLDVSLHMEVSAEALVELAGHVEPEGGDGTATRSLLGLVALNAVEAGGTAIVAPLVAAIGRPLGQVAGVLMQGEVVLEHGVDIVGVAPAEEPPAE